MKATITLILLACAYSHECWSYQCKPSSLRFESTTCIMPDESSSTYYLQPCDGFCDVSAGLKNSTCVESAPVESFRGYPGVFCELDSDCRSGECKSKRCKGKERNESCSRTIQCDPGLYCANNVCTKLISNSRTDCSNDFQCEMDSGCNNGVCTRYFSLNNGEAIDSCQRENQGGQSYLCKTGHCTRDSIAGSNGVCSEAPVSNSPIPVKCDSGVDCKGTAGDLNYVASCDCGYNAEGQAYCQTFRGDAPYQNYLDALKNFLRSNKVNDCNTERRFERDCWENADGGKVSLMKFRYEYYPLLIDNDDCVSDVYFPSGAVLVSVALLFFNLF